MYKIEFNIFKQLILNKLKIKVIIIVFKTYFKYIYQTHWLQHLFLIWRLGSNYEITFVYIYIYIHLP